MSDNHVIPESKIRNIGIIAHVDHGKTTLADAIFARTDTKVKFGVSADGSEMDRALDSNELESERGITILSKVSGLSYKGYRINLNDTPGHADFASEVERTLSMLDGVLLVIDAVEGVKPQTRFVLRKALARNCKIIIFVNKIDKLDRNDAEDIIEATENSVITFLYEQIGDESVFDIPVVYGSGRDGYASRNLADALDGKIDNIDELLDTIVEHTPEPKKIDHEAKLLVTMISYDQHLGRQLIGRVYGNGMAVGKSVFVKNQKGELVEKLKVGKIIRYVGTDSHQIEAVGNGDLVGIYTNCKLATVNDTVMLTDSDIIKAVPIDPPILSVTIGPNTLNQGKEGKNVTATAINNRLYKEAESNVGIKIEPGNGGLIVHGRGELQLSILFETMRREDFEFNILGSSINFIPDENGNMTEPIEQVDVEVPLEFMGIVMDSMQYRGASILEMDQNEKSAKISFKIASRSLMGYVSIFNTQTKGVGIITRDIIGYEPMTSKSSVKRKNGRIIASDSGTATAYSINKMLARGSFFITPGDEVFAGQLVGESKTTGDLFVNITKAKKLTNMRASGTDEAIVLPPADKKGLESSIVYIKEGEYIRVTPTTIKILTNAKR